MCSYTEEKYLGTTFQKTWKSFVLFLMSKLGENIKMNEYL